MPFKLVDGVRCTMCGHEYRPVKAKQRGCPKCLKRYNKPPKPCRIDGWVCAKCGYEWAKRGAGISKQAGYVACIECGAKEKIDVEIVCPHCERSFILKKPPRQKSTGAGGGR